MQALSGASGFSEVQGRAPTSSANYGTPSSIKRKVDANNHKGGRGRILG